MGYGTQDKIYLKGGVLENRPEFVSKVTDKRRKNLRLMVSRYLGSPIPDQKVIIELGQEKVEAFSDDYGYFSVWIKPKIRLSAGWHQLSYAIYEDSGKLITKASGEFLIVDQLAQFGVISDVDDTVLVSHATQLFKKLRLILTKNSKTRLPFKGVANFYHKLTNTSNPIFYVSSSEWNLYDFLLDFFKEREIPKGPFLLQEYKSGLRDLFFSGGGSHQHKQEKIERLMKLFPTLKFVLIGDSGQRDTEIYRLALEKYPNRILAVYIRKIGKKDDLDQKANEDFKKKGVPLLLVENTEEALIHAQKIGLFD